MMTNSISLGTSTRTSSANLEKASFSIEKTAFGLDKISFGRVKPAFSFGKISSNIVNRLAKMRPVVALARLYSDVMEEEITPRFTLHLLNVQAAGFFAIAPVDMPLVTRVLGLMWFAASITLAKRAYKGR